MNDIQEKFTKIYKENSWQDGSGPGSTPNTTTEYRNFLEFIIDDLKIKKVLDYGCGDWQFSNLINWDSAINSYIGADIVSHIIFENQKHYQTTKIKFQHIDDNWTMPEVDLIICKDVLQHLSDNLVSELLKKFQEKSKFILITNDFIDKNNRTLTNSNCSTGGWRPLDLEKSPWDLKSQKTYNWKNLNPHLKRTILIKNYDT
jgi:SAM-dependent methyltransferase